jgi:rubredoxin---NAD+ reductase
MYIWECVACGFIYSEEEGMPEDGILPGTKWEDIPADWSCPVCGVAKSDFIMRKVA